MIQLRSGGRFVYDFVVGDDWRIALGVVIALAITALVDDDSAWWILPLVVAVLLAVSVHTVARRRP